MTGFNNGVKDYKFFCFDGRVKLYKVDINRNLNHKAIYFTRDGQRMQVGEAACPPDCNTAINLPINIDSMIEIAERISNGLKFVRVDLYNIRGKITTDALSF